MDFLFTEEQQALRDLAAQIFARQGDDRTRRRDRAAHRRPHRSRAVGRRWPPRTCWASRFRKSSAVWASALLELHVRARTTGPLRRAGPVTADSRARRTGHRRVRHAGCARPVASRSRTRRCRAHRRLRRARRQQRVAVVGAPRCRSPVAGACRAPRSPCPQRTSPTRSSCPRRLPNGLTVFIVDPTAAGRRADSSRDDGA